MKYVTPSIELTSFNCPHCGALAQQFWWQLRAKRFGKDEHPTVWMPDEVEPHIAKLAARFPNEKEDVERWAREMKVLSTGEITISTTEDHSYDRATSNLFFSECYACDRIAVWHFNRLVHPAAHDAPLANGDMPADVRADYDEAAQIVSQSNRGAAALLRLAIQKLAKHLGGAGENLNEDIGKLAKAGLDARIQQALDVVRVIGNNAVHPGTIDLKDDRKSADTLFNLVNLITDSMISQPKHIKTTFDALPKGALDAIAKRDGK